MSLEGPCAVIRGGMHAFPFNAGNGSRSAPRDQPQKQQQHQQHQSPMQHHRFSAPVSNSWGAPPAADDPLLLPEVLHSPRLRSVSSLVLSCDIDDGLSHLPISRARRPREQQQQQQQRQRQPAAEAAAAAAYAGMNEIFNAMSLPPPTTGSNEKLIREQSFPPPNGFPQGGSPGLRRDQSFPPPVQPGLSIDIIQGSVSDWAGRQMGPPATVNGGGGLAGIAGIGLVGGSGLGGGGGGGRGGRSDGRVGGGGVRNSSEFHNNFGGEALQVVQQSNNNSSSTEHVKWEHLDSSGSSGVSRVVGGGRGGCNSSNSGDDDDSMFLDAPSRPLQHTRRPSFDKLAAMIPDIPVRWPSPSSSPAATSAVELIDSNHRPNFDKPKSALVTPTLDPAQPTRGRPCNRPGRPRRTLDDDLLRGGIGGSVRQGRKLGGKRGDAPLSCGPASQGGGPVDLARQARRTAKIERYMYKRSRRKFANSTRDASPSRSRPKAARVRPREKGKFVKTVPDFIPVTAVATDNFVEMDMNHTAPSGAGGMRAAGIGLGNGMGMRVGGGGGRGGAAKHGEATINKRPMVRLGPSSEAWRNARLQCPGTGAIVPPVHGAATDGVDMFYCPP